MRDSAIAAAAAVFGTWASFSVLHYQATAERAAQIEALDASRAMYDETAAKARANIKADQAALSVEVERECRAVNGSIFAMPPKHGPVACLLPPGAVIPAHGKGE